MDEERKKQVGRWGVYLPIGIGLGTGVGALVGNIGVGMCFGVAVGTMLSLLAYYRTEAS